MKIQAVNRPDDKRPILIIEAENPDEKRQLETLLAALHHIQKIAAEHGKAGRGNPCGSAGMANGLEGIERLSLQILLGGQTTTPPR